MSKANLENLSNEIILEIFSYLDMKDLIQCSHLSKRFRAIAQSDSLWQKINLYLKRVPIEFLEFLLSKGCKYISLSCTKLEGSLKINEKSQLKYLESLR